MCVSQKHLKLHSFPLTSAAWSESEVAGRPTEHNCSCLCKVKSDGFSKPPPTPASSTPSLSLSFIMFLGPRPDVSCKNNPPKIHKKRARACSFLPAGWKWRRGGAGAASHVCRPGRRRAPVRSEPSAASTPWGWTLGGHRLGPQGLKDGPSPQMPGSWPHWGPRGGRGPGKSRADLQDQALGSDWPAGTPSPAAEACGHGEATSPRGASASMQ